MEEIECAEELDRTTQLRRHISNPHGKGIGDGGHQQQQLTKKRKESHLKSTPYFTAGARRPESPHAPRPPSSSAHRLEEAS